MAATSKFTDKYIQSLQPKPSPYRLWEKGSDEGFGIQVSKGARSFFIQYHSPITGKRRFMNLGRYPDTSLADARQRCRDARNVVQTGKDPQIEKERQKEEDRNALLEFERQRAIESSTGTVEQLFSGYVSHLQARGTRTHKDVQNLFQHDIRKAIGLKKAREVTAQDVRDILRTIYKRGAKTRANRAHAYMSAAFSFGIKSDHSFTSGNTPTFYLESNPVRDIPKPSNETPGERELSADEIRELWIQLDASNMQHSSKTALRLLFTTGGQRIEEVLGMRWDEIDFERRTWELSGSRTKNGRPHVVPLSELSIDLIRSMENLKSGDFVFPHRDNPSKHYVATSLGRAVNRFCKGENIDKPFPHFTPRDIRRTVKSRMGELGIRKEIRDRLQNHALHDVSSKHYDRYDYLEPKWLAIEKWTSWLTGLITNTEPDSNIIELVSRSRN